MKTKVIFGLVIVVLFAINAFAGEEEFSKGDWFVTPQVATYSYATNFGASLEYAITENIGLGGTVMLAFWDVSGYSSTLITPSFDAAYHFTRINARKFDLYLGASMGYSIYSSDWVNLTSGVFISPFIGARYYLGRKVALNLRLNFSAVGDFDGVGGLFGVTFKL